MNLKQTTGFRKTHTCPGLNPGWKKWLFVLLVVVAICTGSIRSTFAGGPENVVVVVNASSPDSLAVANHYVHLRNIPVSNVIYLDTVKILKNVDLESSHTKYFRSQVIDPVMETIQRRGLEGQIDCIVYSAGFPTRFNFKPELDKYLKNSGLKYDVHFHAPWASLTSLTYFYDNVFSAKPYFLELDANWYAKPQVRDVLGNPFAGEMAKEYDAAIDKYRNREYEDSIRIFSKLVEQNPEQVAARYYLAKSFGSHGDTEKAMEQLTLCQQQGWSHRSAVAKDPSFSELRSDAKFEDILNKMLDLPVKFATSRSFTSRKDWAKNGWANGSQEQGRRYMLSTVLAVTGKGGSTLTQAIDQIESSVKADGTNPQGTFFFAKHKDVRSRVRHAQFDQAASELRSLGFKVEISDKTVPQNENQIVGATLGSAVIDWKKSKSKFVPGALCDNFTSYGAWWPKAAQTQVTDYLDAGAAGASGTVYEPYTIPPKFPDARLHVHYAHGCTLAEAFYQSVSCPFQLLVVGDPLCCPFGDFPKFEIEGLTTQSVVKDDFDLTVASQPEGPEISHFEIFLDGRYLSTTPGEQDIRIETNDLSDGYHEVRMVAVSSALVATRTSQRLEFWLRREGHAIEINVENQQVQMGDPVIVTASSSLKGEIEIRQNSRVVGKIKGDQKLRLDPAVLGQGKSKLQGFVVGSKTIASVPVEIEILP